MNLTPEVVEDILFEYKRTRSPFKVAKLVGVDVADVWHVIEENSDKLTSYNERNGGWGRPDILRYAVARRMITTRQWDNNDPDIAATRSRYELGVIDMATGRDGGWLILYAFPRKKPQPRFEYFKLETC